VTALAPTAPAAGTRGGIRAFLTNKWFLRAASLAIFLGLWEFYGRDLPYSTSSPSAIVAAGVKNFWPDVASAFGDSLQGLAAGFGMAIVIGIPIGLLMSYSRVAEIALSPYVSALYATPRITLIPVLVLWLGISFNMRVGIVFLSALFPILLNTYLGGKEVNQGLLDVGHAFTASKAKIYRGILLRGSLPYVFSGLRLGLGRCLGALVIAEIATSGGGVGRLITDYAKYFRIDAMFSVIVLLGILALLITGIISRLQVSFTEPWVAARKKARKAAAR
jgi:NitT/TauT family transport system permease protein